MCEKSSRNKRDCKREKSGVGGLGFLKPLFLANKQKFAKTGGKEVRGKKSRERI